MRCLGALLTLAASAAGAHPEGFHQRLTFTVSRTTLTGLLVLDVDSGERCELLRAGADANHDGTLSKTERQALEKKLRSFVERPLKLAISSFPLPPGITESKLSLRSDDSVSRSGLSLALLLEVKHPSAISPGMHLEVTSSSPDLSPIRLEVLQAAEPAEAPFAGEVDSGAQTRVRLGALVDAK